MSDSPKNKEFKAAKQEGSLIQDLQKILLQHEAEKEAEKKKNAELLDICKNLQNLLDEATASMEQSRVASRKKQEELEEIGRAHV